MLILRKHLPSPASSSSTNTPLTHSEPPATPFNFSSSLPYSPPSSEVEVEEEQMLTLEEQVQKYKKEREIEMAAIQSVEEEEESTEQFPDGPRSENIYSPPPSSTPQPLSSFLHQRTLQTLLFLLHQTRDPHTVQYLENFINSTGLSSYHGLGGVWERGNEENGFYERLIGEEKHKITVSCRKRGLGRGGENKTCVVNIFRYACEEEGIVERNVIEGRMGARSAGCSRCGVIDNLCAEKANS